MSVQYASLHKHFVHCAFCPLRIVALDECTFCVLRMLPCSDILLKPLLHNRLVTRALCQARLTWSQLLGDEPWTSRVADEDDAPPLSPVLHARPGPFHPKPYGRQPRDSAWDQRLGSWINDSGDALGTEAVAQTTVNTRAQTRPQRRTNATTSRASRTHRIACHASDVICGKQNVTPSYIGTLGGVKWVDGKVDGTPTVCAECQAWLFDHERVPIPRFPGLFRGRSCCSNGHEKAHA